MGVVIPTSGTNPALLRRNGEFIVDTQTTSLGIRLGEIDVAVVRGV